MSESARLPREILRLIWEYLYAWQPLTLKIDIREDPERYSIDFTTRTQLHVPCKEAWEVQRSSRPPFQQLETRYVRYSIQEAPIAMGANVRTLYFAQGLEYLPIFTSAFPTVKTASIAMRIETAAYEQLDLTELSNEFPCLEEIYLVSPADSLQCGLQAARDDCREKLRQIEEACERVMEWPYAASTAVTRHIPVHFRLEGGARDSSNAPASHCCISFKPGAQLVDFPAGYCSVLKQAIRAPKYYVAGLNGMGITVHQLVDFIDGK